MWQNYYVNLYVVKLLCKFVCSVGRQSYFNTGPSGIHCNPCTLSCCMTESVRNQYRPLRWLKIADSGIRTRARARAITRADQSTNQASRKSRAPWTICIYSAQWHSSAEWAVRARICMRNPHTKFVCWNHIQNKVRPPGTIKMTRWPPAHIICEADS